MKKKLFALILSVMLIVGMALPASADSSVVFDTMVVDMAKVLTESEALELNQRAKELTQQYQCAVYIVTTNDLEGYEPWRYCEIMHRQFKMGYGAEQSCIILLLAVNSRDYNIMAHGYGNVAFTDYGKEVMSDCFLDEFGYNDWYGGFTEYIDCCEEFLQLAKDGTPFDIDNEADPVTAVLIGIVVGLAVAAVVCSVFAFQMKSARRQTDAGSYITDQGLVLTGRSDRFVYTTRTKRYIPPNNNKNSSSGRGGTSINSNGSSHRGGKF